MGLTNLERDIGSAIQSSDIDVNYKSNPESEKDQYYQQELQADNYMQDMKMIKGDSEISFEKSLTNKKKNLHINFNGLS